MYTAFAHREESRGQTCGVQGPHVRETARRVALPAVYLTVGELSGDGTSSARLRRVDWWASRRGLMTGLSRRRATAMGDGRS